MNTTQSNSPFGQQSQAGNNKKKAQGNAGQQAAAAGIGAAVGGMAGWASNELAHEDEPIIVDSPEEPITPPVNNTATPSAAQSSATSAQTGHTATSAQEAINGISNGGSANNGGNSNGGGSAINGGEINNGGEVNPPVNIDEIHVEVEGLDISSDAEVDAIIAEEQIDAADINVEDPLVFDSVGTVYTLDGEAYSTATFHFDGDDQQFVMVDVDGDEVFDIITDDNLEIVSTTAFDMTYADAEQQISATDPNYMAASENEVEMPDDVDFMDDIITT